jgi:hypothetical protein
MSGEDALLKEGRSLRGKGEAGAVKAPAFCFFCPFFAADARRISASGKTSASAMASLGHFGRLGFPFLELLAPRPQKSCLGQGRGAFRRQGKRALAERNLTLRFPIQFE